MFTPQPWRDLRWQSDAALTHLEALLTAATVAWRADWELDSEGPVRVDRAWEAGLLRRDSTPWQAFASDANGDTAAWVQGDTAVHQASLVRCLFRTDKSPTCDSIAIRPSLAGAVAQEALDALLAALSSALKLQHVTLAQSERLQAGPPAADQLAWSGAVQVQLNWGKAREDGVNLHLGAGAMVHGQRRPSAGLPRHPALTDLSAAVGTRPVRIRATLSETEIELGELLSLQVGDILVTNHPLVHPLEVAARPADASTPFRTLLAAHLGSRDGRVALAFANPSHPENPNEQPRTSSRQAS